MATYIQKFESTGTQATCQTMHGPKAPFLDLSPQNEKKFDLPSTEDLYWVSETCLANVNGVSSFWIYGRRAVDSMSSSVSVNQKRLTKEYSHLIKLQMCEDRFPINARMTDCTIESREQNMSNLVMTDLTVDFRLVKPDNVRKRELLVKTEEKMRIY